MVLATKQLPPPHALISLLWNFSSEHMVTADVQKSAVDDILGSSGDPVMLASITST